MKELTQSEISILKLASQGYDKKQIAAKLYMSRHTVKSFITKISKQYNSTDLTTIYKIIKGIVH